MDFPRTVVLAGNRSAGLSPSGRPWPDAPCVAAPESQRLAAPGAADLYGVAGIGIDLSAAAGADADSASAARGDMVAESVPTGFARLDAELPGGGWPRRALADARVHEGFAARQVLLLRADWTRRDPLISAELARLGRSGVPVYAIYVPGGGMPRVLSELIGVAEVREALAQR